MEIVFIGDSRVVQIPEVDNGEPIVDLAVEFPMLKFDFSRQFVQKISPSISWGRREIGRRLVQAQQLLPGHCQLLIKECYRPPLVQKQFWDGHLEFLTQKFPDWDSQRLYIECSKYAAPTMVAPHCTGGAVDLILIDEQGEWLDMGSRFNAEPSGCEYRTYFSSDKISPAAKNHRKILAEVMSACGFVNYPTEWWHWSYGDKYWAFITNAKSAIYHATDIDRA